MAFSGASSSMRYILADVPMYYFLSTFEKTSGSESSNQSCSCNEQEQTDLPALAEDSDKEIEEASKKESE